MISETDNFFKPNRPVKSKKRTPVIVTQFKIFQTPYIGMGFKKFASYTWRRLKQRVGGAQIFKLSNFRKIMALENSMVPIDT